MSKEAITKAIEVLKKCHYYMIDAGLPNQSMLIDVFTAYKALEAALAEQPAPVQPGRNHYEDGDVFERIAASKKQPAQEPVAWQVELFIAGKWVPLGNPQRSKIKAETLASNPSLHKEHPRIFPVYRSPQPAQRKPLTLREIGAACGNFSDEAIKVVRQTEAAHGIKGNT